MGSLEMTCVELERGSSAVSNVSNIDCKDESLCFSQPEEVLVSKPSEGPIQPLIVRIKGHVSISEIDYVLYSKRVSDVVAMNCVVNTENDVDEVRISVGTTERECRICKLSLDSESGIAIELGCSCKNELAAAHQHCAETWFRSKGNKICEICKSIAQNVAIPNNSGWRRLIFGVNRFVTNSDNRVFVVLFGSFFTMVIIVSFSVIYSVTHRDY